MNKVLLIALAFLAVGCRRGRTVEPVEYRTMERASLLAAHNAGARRISALTADVRMTISWTEDDRIKSHTANAWLDLERPSRIRLVHDAIGRDLFYVLSDGLRFWVGLDKALTGEDDSLTTGPVAALDEYGYFLRPDRLLEITALPILPPPGASGGIFAEYTDRYVYLFPDAADPGRLLARAVFSREDLRLSQCELFDGGRLAVHIEYEEYLSKGDVHAPHKINVEWPAEGISAAMTLTRIKVGGELSPKLWQYRWRENVTVNEIESNRP